MRATVDALSPRAAATARDVPVMSSTAARSAGSMWRFIYFNCTNTRLFAPRAEWRSHGLDGLGSARKRYELS